MVNGKATIRRTAFLVLSLVLAGCDGDPTAESGVATLSVHPGADIIGVGETLLLVADARDANGDPANEPVAWGVEGGSALGLGTPITVDGRPAIRARGLDGGSARVTAEAGGMSASAEIVTLSLTPATHPGIGGIFDIWGTGPDDVWVVGNSGCHGACLLHWDGTEWTGVAGTHVLLLSVWGPAPGEVWAVGYSGRILHVVNGAVDTVASPTDVTLGGVWGSGPSDVWAVGEGGIILHYDGVAWTDVTPDLGLPVGTNLYKPWGSGPGDVWVPAGDRLLHFDGSAWSVVDEVSAWAVWGSGPDDVWVGGYRSLRHFDGDAWVDVDRGNTAVHRLWGVEGDLWAAGADYVSGYTGGEGEIHHYNASAHGADPLVTSAWARLDVGGGPFRAIWGASARDIWVATASQIYRLGDG